MDVMRRHGETAEKHRFTTTIKTQIRALPQRKGKERVGDVMDAIRRQGYTSKNKYSQQLRKRPIYEKGTVSTERGGDVMDVMRCHGYLPPRGISCNFFSSSHHHHSTTY